MLAHDSYKEEKKVTEWFARASAAPGASHASLGLGRDTSILAFAPNVKNTRTIGVNKKTRE